MNTVVAAADRYFRLYAKHSLEPNEDTLFTLLNALHSFNEKIQKSENVSLFGSTEFVALKSLRNLFHHEAELLHEVRIIPAKNLPDIITDLAIICLVERSLVEQAAGREKKNDRKKILGAFKWYGTITNIHPCIFNASVVVYETIQPLGIILSSEAYQAFKSSYQFETEHGHSHFVNGDISCRAGDVDEVLQKVFHQNIN